ncbi:ATP-dependent RNA helicase HrpA [Aquihabitans sp. G128]|uniref:ATP-dependent RNA helicase HrpA n=1 Tax=Aquihabitans sp. G128 TaxID=2849779 RepID=UPI001C2413CE|nr:ATP-dependent RNA helicase HrpA [Aquihabitans sp. G128]QXC61183.1 ATP-dependent RNA helicase HrpA [Aquihabitans sp. G128]
MSPTDAPVPVAPDAADLRERLASLGRRDQRRLGALLDRVGRPPGGRGGGAKAHRGRGRGHRPEVDRQPVTLEQVAADVATAEARVASRRAGVPTVTYPDGLPISERRQDLLDAIAANQVVIVAGETGSGKSTQLPKLCLELGRGVLGLIGHTQPRRVAARTIAERVAEELGTDLGQAVGYTVRFTDRVGDGTFVKVMTDGILLAEIQRDRLLDRYDTLIIDEAHERSLNIDFLLGYLKQLLPQRPDLKVIITSATIDTGRFSEHFGDAPIIEVSGRTFPVELRYRPYGERGLVDEGDDVIDDDRDQVEAISDAVDELARAGPGDVLVFLSGEREIRDTAGALAKRNLRDTEVLPLYARLSAAEQHRIFEPHRGRRVVLATNVAETSLTVPGVRYVVDAGTARISRYSHRLKVQRLPIEAVSQASANQRAGRCGRVAPGICIRLYAEEDFDGRDEFTDPEIQRTNLASVILQMTNLGLGDVAAFPFLDPPDSRAIRDGVHLLEELGALPPDQPADERRLTPTGRRLAQLPIDPRLARMVLEAQEQGCVREVLIIASALSIQDPRERPTDKQQAADELHRRFTVPGSDFLALVRLWDHLAERRKALSSNQFRRECRSEFLNFLRIREWQDLYRQLEQAARKLSITPSAGEVDAEQVHRALLAGLLSQIGVKDPEGREFRGARNSRFQLAHGSSLAKKPPPWVMAAELVETNRLWARTAAAVQPEWAEALAPHLVKRSYGEPRWDERSGRAVTNERVTLYGLPLVAARKVGYDRVDVDEARDLFLDHALQRREWSSRHPFLAANEAFLAEARDLGDRVRRVDLFDDDVLFRFYDRRVGLDVVSGRHFDQWWKQARRDDPDLLTLTMDDLTGDGPAFDPADYPDTWRQGDLELPVTYRFAPGEDLDGVTVHIPMAVLNRVEPWDFDWQVPGFRRELAEALVRTAPKAVRRLLTPLGETAERAADQLRWQEVPITEALAAVTSELAGARVEASDLDARRVLPYLRITFAIHDGDTVVAIGKDLDAVRDLVGGRVRAAIADAIADQAPDIERTGITRWDLGDLPRVVRSTIDGHVVEGYPALLDAGDSVSIKVFSKPEIAERIMAVGVRRLVLLAVPVGVKGLEREVPNTVRLALSGVPELTLGKLLRDAITASADRVVADAGGVAWDEEAFTALLAAARSKLKATTAKALRDAGEVVVAAAAVEAQLDRLTSPLLDASVADARAQLRRLVRPGFVTSCGTHRLPDVLRYVRGIGKRLEKVAGEPRRDQERILEVAGVERYYQQLLTALLPSQVTKRVVDAGWQLEELRVSVFAQSVGVKGQVSAKRVRREIDHLFAGELD